MCKSSGFSQLFSELRIPFIKVLDGIIPIKSRIFIWCGYWKPELSQNSAFHWINSRTSKFEGILSSEKVCESSDFWFQYFAEFWIYIHPFLGIIAYMLVTGGKSPFYGGHRFRTIAKILSCQYDLHGPEFNYISREAKDFIQQLLQTQQMHRMNVNQCLKHDWLEGPMADGETMHTLEVIPNLEVKLLTAWYTLLENLKLCPKIQFSEK